MAMTKDSSAGVLALALVLARGLGVLWRWCGNLKLVRP